MTNIWPNSRSWHSECIWELGKEIPWIIFGNFELLLEDFGPKILEFLETTSQNNNVKGEFLSRDSLVIYSYPLPPSFRIKQLKKSSTSLSLCAAECESDFTNMYRNRTCRYNYMQYNYATIHCNDLGMRQLLRTAEQISSNRSILTIIGLFGMLHWLRMSY